MKQRKSEYHRNQDRREIRVAFLLAYAFLLLFIGVFGCGSGGSMPNSYIAFISPRRWTHSPITYKVVGGESQIPFVDPKKEAETGINRWKDAIAPIVLSEVGESDPVDITVTFATQDEIDAIAGVHGDLGVTTTKTESDGVTLVSAHCYLLRSLSPTRLDDAATHEYGHSLGLGHSPFRGDVMYPVIPLGGHLTQRDRNTVRLVYGLPL